jgi:hypothetical protein
VIPPGVDHNLWFIIYNNAPKIKSGKGNSSPLQLAHRLAHYLGFSIPPTRVPPSPPFDVVVTHTSGVMTIEEKKAMIALLQAQVDGEGKSEGNKSEGNNNNNGEPANSSTA